jgi:hypothetical protein
VRVAVQPPTTITAAATRAGNIILGCIIDLLWSHIATHEPRLSSSSVKAFVTAASMSETSELPV